MFSKRKKVNCIISDHGYWNINLQGLYSGKNDSWRVIPFTAFSSKIHICSRCKTKQILSKDIKNITCILNKDFLINVLFYFLLRKIFHEVLYTRENGSSREGPNDFTPSLYFSTLLLWKISKFYNTFYLVFCMGYVHSQDFYNIVFWCSILEYVSHVQTFFNSVRYETMLTDVLYVHECWSTG